MKFGADTLIWEPGFGDDSLWLVDKVREMGFDVIEIPIFSGTPDFNYIGARKAIEEAGLECSVLSVLGEREDINSEDETLQQNALNHLKRCISAAEKLGAGAVAGPLYAPLGKKRVTSPEQKKAEWERCVKNLRKAAEFASEHGVVIALEPLNRFETDFINIVSDAVRLVEDINHPAVGIQLDTFHMNIEEKSIPEAIRKAGKYAYHMHACENDRGTPGTGHIPWKEVAKALKDIKYDRYVVIEAFSQVSKDLAAATACWRPLEIDNDTIARKGLKFLKSVMA